PAPPHPLLSDYAAETQQFSDHRETGVNSHVRAGLHRVWRALWGPVLVILLSLLSPFAPATVVGTEVLPWIPRLVWPAVPALAAVFARNRVFFLSIAAALTWVFQEPAVVEAAGGTGALPLSVLLPPVLVVFTVLPERGILSRPGILRWGILILLLGSALAWGRAAEASRAARVAETLTLARIPIPGVSLSILQAGYIVAAAALLGFALARGRLSDGLAPAYLAAQAIAAQGVLLQTAFPVAAASSTAAAAIAGLIAVVLDAYALAYKDALTGLPGRRALEEYGRRLGRRYAVAMADIDHFKQFNDTHGHAAGDQVLRMVATRLAAARVPGRVFRYGGEEFTIIFNHDDVDGVAAGLEDLRSRVAGTPFVLRGATRGRDRSGKSRRSRGGKKHGMTVTVSIGFAIHEGSDRSVEETRERADRALYKAKKKGRNRVERADA
ncbi:MAG: diguanylate cyclase, partial [bacterium]